MYKYPYVLFILYMLSINETCTGQGYWSEAEYTYLLATQSPSNTIADGVFILTNDLAKDIWLSEQAALGKYTNLIVSQVPVSYSKLPVLNFNDKYSKSLNYSSRGGFAGSWFSSGNKRRGQRFFYTDSWNVKGVLNPAPKEIRDISLLQTSKKYTVYAQPSFIISSTLNSMIQRKWGLKLYPLLFMNSSYLGNITYIHKFSEPVKTDWNSIYKNRYLAGIHSIYNYQFIKGIEIESSVNYKIYRETGWWGMKNYRADQHSANAEVVYKYNYKYTHLAAGLKYRYDHLTEYLGNSGYDRYEKAPRIYANYSSILMIKDPRRLSFTVSGRVDWHNLFGLMPGGSAILSYNYRRLSVSSYSSFAYSPANYISAYRNLLAGNHELYSFAPLFAEKFWDNGLLLNYRLLNSVSLSAHIQYTKFFDRMVPVLSETRFSILHGSGNDLLTTGNIEWQYNNRTVFKVSAQYKKVTLVADRTEFPVWYTPNIACLANWLKTFDIYNPLNDRRYTDFSFSITQNYINSQRGFTDNGKSGRVVPAAYTDIFFSKEFYYYKYPYVTRKRFNVSAGIINVFNQKTGNYYITGTSPGDYSGPQWNNPARGRRIMFEVFLKF